MRETTQDDAGASFAGAAGAEAMGRYRVGRKLHVGASATVYLGHQECLDRQVVIKVLDDDDESAAKALQSEFSLLSRLRHPNNVRVFDAGTHRGRGSAKPYVVLEYIEGNTLRTLLQDERRLSVFRTWRLALQALAALVEAHELGIVHRDIKPENLMIWRPPGLEEHLKVIDYGLAKVEHFPTKSSGGIRGTPQYIAPEVVEGGKATAQSDLYGVGVVMYECLAGMRPFDANEPLAVLFQQVYKQPEPLRDIVPIPEQLAQAVHKALSKDPSERCGSAREMLHELRQICFQELRRCRSAAFESLPIEETFESNVFAPGAFEAISGVLGEEGHLATGEWESPVGLSLVNLPKIRSTQMPVVWVLSEDPALNQRPIRLALAQLATEYEVVVVDAGERAALAEKLAGGSTAPPWVLLFGDLHVILEDELLGALRTTPECSKLLISTHANAELLQTTVNLAGLDHSVVLPAGDDEIVRAVRRMVDRSHVILAHYDQLRLALRDAQSDVARLFAQKTREEK